MLVVFGSVTFQINFCSFVTVTRETLMSIFSRYVFTIWLQISGPINGEVTRVYIRCHSGMIPGAYYFKSSAEVADDANSSGLFITFILFELNLLEISITSGLFVDIIMSFIRPHLFQAQWCQRNISLFYQFHFRLVSHQIIKLDQMIHWHFDRQI